MITGRINQFACFVIIVQKMLLLWTIMKKLLVEVTSFVMICFWFSTWIRSLVLLNFFFKHFLSSSFLRFLKKYMVQSLNVAFIKEVRTKLKALFLTHFYVHIHFALSFHHCDVYDKLVFFFRMKTHLKFRSQYHELVYGLLIVFARKKCSHRLVLTS